MQWRLAIIIVLVLWFGALPTLVYVSIVRDGGINAIWSTFPLFYVVLNIFLMHSYITANWHAISCEVRERRRSSADIMVSETTLLLDATEQPELM